MSRFSGAGGRAYDAHFQKAISLQERPAHAFQHARTLLCYGERLRRARRRRDARVQLQAAIEIFDRLDARPWASASQGRGWLASDS